MDKFKAMLESNQPFEKRCLRCGRIFNIRDYHPIHFSKRKFCCSSCAGGSVTCGDVDGDVDAGGSIRAYKNKKRGYRRWWFRSR